MERAVEIESQWTARKRERMGIEASVIARDQDQSQSKVKVKAKVKFPTLSQKTRQGWDTSVKIK
jgi:hypothetical protein